MQLHPRPLLPGEYSILALLAMGPMHGYEMARYFDRDDLTEVCPIEQSLLYTYLRNIEERGLVTWQEVRVGNRPPRKQYMLTEAGLELVDTWLHQPVSRMREVRIEFLLKVYFLHRMDSEAEIELLHNQAEVCEAYRERLQERVRTTAGFPQLVARSKLSAAEATLGWIRSYLWELENMPRQAGK